MINFFRQLFTVQKKQSEARSLIAKMELGREKTPPVDYAMAAREGYQRTITVFRCINLIARNTARLQWELYQKRNGERMEIKEHPLLDLLSRPNPSQGGVNFFNSVVGFKQIAGNSYIEAVKGGGGPPKELWPLRPDRMTIKPGTFGLPKAYVYKFKGSEKVWDVDPVTGQGLILHMKSFHPTDDWYGLSPIEAAFLNIANNKEADKYNVSLLKNSATPSGVLEVRVDDSNPRGSLTDEQYSRLKEFLDDEYSGSLNAGRPMLLEGGLSWKAVGMTPKQLDMLENKNATSRDIAQAFDVPPLLLGLPGDNTFANYKEARAAFYEDTILPAGDELRDELNNWLVPMFGDNLELDYDRDNIEALAHKRQSKFESLKSASYLTENEKREAAGYDKQPGLDFYVYKTSDQILGDQALIEDNSDDEQQNAIDSNEKNPDENADEKMRKIVDHEINHVKIFNVVNERERRQSWIKQNRQRNQLQVGFENDLLEDFQKMFSDVRAVKDTGLDSIEFAIERVLVESHKQMANTIAKHTRRALREFGRVAFADAKYQRLETIEHKSAFSRFMDFVELYVINHTAEAIKNIENTSSDRIRKTIKELVLDTIESGEGSVALANRIEETFSDENAITVNKSRAQLIARTEIGMASNSGLREAVKSLQVPNLVKEWISAQDERVRDDENVADHRVMNGEKVGLDEKFTVPPDASMDGPGDPSAPIEQLARCRCVLTYQQIGR